MGKDSKIAWTDHTFNPWHGCAKISPGCLNCYAEGVSKRWGKDLWGVGADRMSMSDNYWTQPKKWDNFCAKNGVRKKVFVGSMCDLMEDRRDLDDARARLFNLVTSTPNLDWLFLTKRPQNYKMLLPASWLGEHGGPPNVWYGCTVECQDTAEFRINELAQIPADVRFLSCEPLLSPLNLGLIGTAPKDWGYGYCEVGSLINWVIVGAESGARRRPFSRDWARDIRDECLLAGVPFFYKQEIDPRGKKIETPELDGEVYTQVPGGLYED